MSTSTTHAMSRSQEILLVSRRELRNPDGKLVTEIVYLNRNGRREPISIAQHAFHYHITIQYLGD